MYNMLSVQNKRKVYGVQYEVFFTPQMIDHTLHLIVYISKSNDSKQSLPLTKTSIFSNDHFNDSIE